MKYVVFSIVIFVFLQANCTTIFPFQQDKGSGEFFEQKEGKLTLNAPTETAKRQWIFPFEAIKNTQWQLTISLDFEPSTSNYMDWYLVASEQNLESSTAYFIRWGMTGNEDVLQFFKQKNGQKTLLAQGKTIVSKGGKIQLLVTRNEYGFWQIYLNDIAEMSIFDNEILTNQYTGIVCAHTSTRSKSFAFEDFSLMEYVENQQDTDKEHAIVFTEILLTPSTNVFLPNAQYLELYNRSANEIQLKNWSLVIDNQVIRLDSFRFLPNTYLILFSQETSELFVTISPKLACLGMKMNTKKGKFTLINPIGKQIESLEYDEKIVLKNTNKSKGGWALERKDRVFFCDDFQNWDYSTNEKGGTPSLQNSLNQVVKNEKKPQMTSVFWKDSTQLIVEFDDKIVSAFFDKKPILVDTFWNENTQICVKFKSSNIINQVIELTVENCFEYRVQTHLMIGKPEKVLEKDVFISEILPDPFENGTEFIELYNASDKIIDLSSLVLGTKNEDDTWKTKISLPNSLFFPKTYVVLTIQKQGVLSLYDVPFPQQIYEVSLPILTNEKGIIALTDNKGQFLDKVNYTENQHYTFIKNTKGVSLERISFEISANETGNWLSASELVSWASPTQQNSQYLGVQAQSMQLISTIITPDNDGFQDNLQVQYVFENENWMGTFHVFAQNGYKITTFEEQTFLGKQGIVHWDITNEYGQLVPLGFYVLVIELYNEKGEMKTLKMPFCIAN